MNHGLGRCQQGSEPRVAPLAEPGQPGEAPMQRAGKLRHPARPAAVILRVVAYQERKRRVLDARFTDGMKLSNPAGGFNQSTRLLGGLVGTEIEHARGTIGKFEDQPGVAGSRFD